MKLEDLEVYKLSREISRLIWEEYEKLNWQDKKVMGDQWISAIDSIGANIAEGFGRFHYLDKNKFNYNARGSLLESIYWTHVLFERKRIPMETHKILLEGLESLHHKLNNYIRTTKEQVNPRN
ncbi:MAG: four helix bundle protein [Candidatus Liptonbacteria bacterium]|nr:four helix bundle protein [Candidatus Liptonbacteria bacterium]